MNFLFLLLVIAIVLVLASHLYTAMAIARLRASGVYPMPGEATMADVERLKSLGLSVWAVRCYREIYGCSLREAKEAVEHVC